ncbi:hypothetical protein QBC43DRAFT_345858 [Cladorrhinum sp. PSN259]|nr:hypothetical protein QBC43DRAFT_345858 [Cladorrhinum sp. PSN259]
MASVSGTVQRGGFIEFCAYQGANLTAHSLSMYCQNNNTEIFGYNYTYIDLDFCVGNNGGQLVSWENGSYSGTCTNCTIAIHETVDLTCSCWDTNNQHVVSTLDLNTTIFDVDGSAACYTHVSNKTWEGNPNVWN